MNNFKLRTAVAALAGVTLFGINGIAKADSTDDLLKKLRDKGVLTEQEFDEFNSTRDTEKAKKSKEIKASFKDGIVFESGDKSFAMQVNGRVHADYRTYFGYDESDKPNTAPAGGPLANGAAVGADTYDIRRARIGVKAKFYDNYEFEAVANLTGGAPIMDVAYMNVNWWEQAQFRIGQFKMPMNLEELTSSNNIDFMERSFVNSMAPAKEIGAMIHGVPTKGVTYALAFSNGAGQNNAEADIKVDNKDVIGRVTANIAEIMGNSDMVLHAGVAYSKGDVAPGTIGVAGRTEARGATFFQAPVLSASSTTIDRTVDRDRLGLEAVVAYGPFKVQSEWLRTSYDFDRTATVSNDVDLKAWYAEALWLITGENYASFYKNGAFGALKPKNDFIHPSAAASSGAWGLWELGLRYSKFDASDFNVADFKTAGGATGLTTATAGFAEANAWTAGIKFLPNANTRFMMNYVRTDYNDMIGTTGVTVNNKREDDERALIMRAQWMF